MMTVPAGSGVGSHDKQHARQQQADSPANIAKVRAMLSAADQSAADDAMVARYIRATGGDLAFSAKRLTDTLAWRRQRRPDLVVCTECAKNPRAHYMHPVGFDLRQRPIIYSCNGMAVAKDFKTNEAHMINCFEHTIKLMPPGVEKWTWVLDFYGFGFADCNIKLARAFLDMSAAHYPERLGLVFAVDAPRVFSTLWAAIEPYVDPKTREKIRFLPYDVGSPKSQLEAAVTAQFDPQMSSWLLREMGENRTKQVARGKAHSPLELHQAASRGGLAELVGGNSSPMSRSSSDASASQAPTPVPASPGSSSGRRTPSPALSLPLDRAHSLWGAPDLLACYHQQPELLLPLAPSTGH